MAQDRPGCGLSDILEDTLRSRVPQIEWSVLQVGQTYSYVLHEYFQSSTQRVINECNISQPNMQPNFPHFSSDGLPTYPDVFWSAFSSVETGAENPQLYLYFCLQRASSLFDQSADVRGLLSKFHITPVRTNDARLTSRRRCSLRCSNSFHGGATVYLLLSSIQHRHHYRLSKPVSLFEERLRLTY